MTSLRKLPPVDPRWAERAECKYDDPDKWDLEANGGKGWKKGRRICITQCPVREACLRKALGTEGGTIGVIRGGVVFDRNQQQKKRSTCSLCGYPIAQLKKDADGKKVNSICWMCRRYAPCLNQCGRMVVRKVGLDSYYCQHCAK